MKVVNGRQYFGKRAPRYEFRGHRVIELSKSINLNSIEVGRRFASCVVVFENADPDIRVRNIIERFIKHGFYGAGATVTSFDIDGVYAYYQNQLGFDIIIDQTTYDSPIRCAIIEIVGIYIGFCEVCIANRKIRILREIKAMSRHLKSLRRFGVCAYCRPNRPCALCIAASRLQKN